MDIIKYDIYSGPNIGIYSTVNDEFVFLPRGFSDGKSEKLSEYLEVKSLEISVANARVLGILMVVGGKLKVKTGISLAIFYVLIFPGNINQYVNEIDAFNLNTDTSRFMRLLFQPILVLLALFSSGGLRFLKNRKRTN